ncbi:MAG: hypothetical protein AB1746_15430 [Candidatus Zixiibacteriota bacterium]
MGNSGALLGKTIILIGLLIIVPWILPGCKGQEVECAWMANPTVIDGQRNDWKDMPFTYFEDEDVVLGLSNDNDNLYVFFSFKNAQWARMIQMSGITLWFDGKGKKNKNWGLRYRGGPKMPERQDKTDDRMRDMPDDMMDKSRQNPMENGAPFAIISKTRDQEYIIDTSGSDGPAVSSAVTNGIYTYEFRIPIRVSGNELYNFSAAPGQIVGIGSEWGGMPEGMSRPEGGGRPGGVEPPDGGFPGGGGGFPGGGGGMGGGPGGGPPGGGREMPSMEKQEIWVKTVLAEAPPTN